MKEYDTRHGGAYDRGKADAYYHRPRVPHMFLSSTYSSPRIEEEAMGTELVAEYNAGYKIQKASGICK